MYIKQTYIYAYIYQNIGKLAIVVSDDSLAFGVNMPFRTCVFAGEMNGELTPLMAQQMSGRAGRRGLDTQGNLVYVGSKASFIRTLMIGKVSEITGEGHEPRYETLFLQGIVMIDIFGHINLRFVHI
jgi:superfamily II RNA helicase